MTSNTVARILLLMVAATAIAPAQSSQADASLRNGDQAIARGHFDQARGDYQLAISNGADLSSDIFHCRNIAQSFLRSNLPDLISAITWLRKAVAIDPDNDETRLRLADTLLQNSQSEAAVGQLHILVAKHPSSSNFVISLASALRSTGNSEQAIGLLDSTLSQYPDLKLVRLEYARTLAYEKRFDAAQGQYSQVLKSDPGNLVAQVGLAKLLSWQGKQEEALASYDHILAAHPSNYDAAVGKGFSLLWMGQNDEAHRLLAIANRRHPEDTEVIEGLHTIEADGLKRQAPSPVAGARIPATISVSKPAEKSAQAQPARRTFATKHSTMPNRVATAASAVPGMVMADPVPPGAPWAFVAVSFGVLGFAAVLLRAQRRVAIIDGPQQTAPMRNRDSISSFVDQRPSASDEWESSARLLHLEHQDGLTRAAAASEPAIPVCIDQPVQPAFEPSRAPEAATIDAAYPMLLKAALDTRLETVPELAKVIPLEPTHEEPCEISGAAASHDIPEAAIPLAAIVEMPTHQPEIPIVAASAEPSPRMPMIHHLPEMEGPTFVLNAAMSHRLSHRTPAQQQPIVLSSAAPQLEHLNPNAIEYLEPVAPQGPTLEAASSSVRRNLQGRIVAIVGCGSLVMYYGLILRQLGAVVSVFDRYDLAKHFIESARPNAVLINGETLDGWHPVQLYASLSPLCPIVLAAPEDKSDCYALDPHSVLGTNLTDDDIVRRFTVAH